MKNSSGTFSDFSLLIGSKPIDVIVVGAGLTGLCAALSALERQAKVVLVDQATQLYTDISPSMPLYVNAVDPERQGELGIVDSAELFYQQTLAAGQSRGNPRLVKELCYKAYIGLKWIERFGITFESKVRQIPGGTFPRTCIAPNAKDCHRKLFAAAQTAGVTMLSGLSFESLIQEKNGRVSGIIVRDMHGDTYRLNAGSVIIATGGFSGNASMCARHDPRLRTLKSLRGGRGDVVLRELVRVGAYLVGMDFIELAFGISSSGGFIPCAMHPLRYCLTDASGRRIVNEEDTATVREAILNAPQRLLLLVASFEERKRLPAYHRQALDHLLAEGRALRIRSEADTAGSSLISVQTYKTLSDTVDNYNQASQDAFAKCWHYPITRDDLLVMPVTLRRAATLGGVQIDEACHVLKADGSPIAGLYAAGEVTGGVHGKHCVPGNMALEAIVFGREAGLSSVSRRD